MWNREVVPDVEEIIGRPRRSAQDINWRLCIEGLHGSHNQGWVTLWFIGVRVFDLLRCACTNLHIQLLTWYGAPLHL